MFFVHRRATLILLVTLLVPALSPARPAAAQAPASQPRQKKVLVIQFARRDAPIAIQTEETYRQRLGEGLQGRLDYYTEYFDVYRFSDIEAQQAFRSYLRDRYAGIGLDLVIAPNTVPLRLVQEGDATIFGDVPVVFHGGVGVTGSRRSTGVVSRVDMTSAMEAALALHPATRSVTVIRGMSPLDVDYGRLAQSQFAPFEPRLSITYLDGLPMPDLEKVVASLLPGAIVYVISYARDVDGNEWLPAEALERIARASAVPVYGWHELFVGRGAVGGKLFSTQANVTATADLALRVLDGTPAESIPVREIDPYVTRFNWRELRRWGIAESSLPAGSVVLYRPPGIWTQYWAWALVGASIAAIALVVWWSERRRRRRAEIESRTYFETLADVERRATASHLTASLAHELRQPLTSILNNIDAARHMLAADSPDLAVLRTILDDISRDDQRAAKIVEGVRTLVSSHSRTDEPLDLNDIVQETMVVIGSEIHATGTRVEQSFSGQPLMVEGDRIHLQQAVLNIVRNAIEAMAGTESAARRLTVTTAGTDSHVEVRVEDNGAGIRHDLLERIFEPFVSTKPNGMGMGLFIVRSIAEAHQGQVVAANGRAGGATVRLVLPRTV